MWTIFTEPGLNRHGEAEQQPVFGFSPRLLHAPALVKAAQGKNVLQGALYSQLWDRDLWLSLRVDHTPSSRTPPSTSYIIARLAAYVNDLFQVTASL